MNAERLEGFIKGYMTAALQSLTVHDQSGEDDGTTDEPIRTNFGIEDIGDETRQRMIDDCRVFWRRNEPLFMLWEERIEEQAGHDFWFARNCNGPGFWDRNERWGKAYAEKFTDDADWFGPHDIAVVDGNVTDS